MKLPGLAVIVVVLTCVASADADVLVVGPQGPHLSIQSAVTAAADGDILLVKSGTYAGFWITGKSVSVVADTQQTVFVQGGISIADLPAGKAVVLDRITCFVSDPGGFPVPALSVTDALGSVRVQDCVLWGSNGQATIGGGCSTQGVARGADAVRLLRAADVALVGGSLTGGVGSDLWDVGCHLSGGVWYGGEGGAGLSAEDSWASLHDVTAVGGPSGDGSYSEQAGPGIRASVGSSLVLVRVLATGGDGGDSLDGIVPDIGGEGGNGLHLEPGCKADLLDCELIGGVQGSGFQEPGGQVADPVGGSGHVSTWSAAASGLLFTKVLRETQVSLLQVSGQQGASVLLFASAGTGRLVLPALEGSFVPDLAALIGPIGVGVLVGDTKTVQIKMPQLPAALEGLGVFLQALLVGPSGSTLSPWGHLTILDSAF